MLVPLVAPCAVGTCPCAEGRLLLLGCQLDCFEEECGHPWLNLRVPDLNEFGPTNIWNLRAWYIIAIQYIEHLRALGDM